MSNPDAACSAFAAKTFSAADQDRFAALSGDVNPMHMDPVAARRLLAGQAVVHGMHLLLHALDRLPQAAGAWPGRITADFGSPVCVGDAALFELAPQKDETGAGITLLRVRVEDRHCSHFELHNGPTQQAPSLPVQPLPVQPALEAVHLPLFTQARQITDPRAWVGQCHRLDLPADDAALAFPRASAWLGERRVAALSLLSYYVGMVCPGLDSIYSSLSVAAGDDDADSASLRFEVRRYDPRFPLFVIRFDGCIQGEIKAFVRARAQQQAPMAQLLACVDGRAFAGKTCWVIGGSRGLGELSAKLIAAGGGEVVITYASGADDAQRVADEIKQAGRGHATVRQLDLTSADLGRWCADQAAPDAVFYFATGRIFRRRAALFDAAAFEEFNTFYVRRFHELCVALEAFNRPLTVFYPSSVAVADRPRGMTEYAMSKAAAELLIDDWNKSSRCVTVLASRLPRLSTDQTASALGSDPMANIDVMLPLIRQMLAAPAA